MSWCFIWFVCLEMDWTAKREKSICVFIVHQAASKQPQRGCRFHQSRATRDDGHNEKNKKERDWVKRFFLVFFFLNIFYNVCYAFSYSRILGTSALIFLVLFLYYAIELPRGGFGGTTCIAM